MAVNKTFILENPVKDQVEQSLHKVHSESKTSLSPSASMIYQNNFYKSSYNNYRQNQLNPKDSHNSYTSSQRVGKTGKSRKVKSRETRGIQMKITKINVSSQPKIASSKPGSRVMGRRKNLHNIKIKKTKNDLQSIMTIKNQQMWFRNASLRKGS